MSLVPSYWVCLWSCPLNLSLKYHFLRKDDSNRLHLTWYPYPHYSLSRQPVCSLMTMTTVGNYLFIYLPLYCSVPLLDFKFQEDRNQVYSVHGYISSTSYWSRCSVNICGMFNEWISPYPNSADATFHIPLEFASFIWKNHVLLIFAFLTAWHMEGIQQMFVDCGYIIITQ